MRQMLILRNSLQDAISISSKRLTNRGVQGLCLGGDRDQAVAAIASSGLEPFPEGEGTPQPECWAPSVGAVPRASHPSTLGIQPAGADD